MRFTTWTQKRRPGYLTASAKYAGISKPGYMRPGTISQAARVYLTQLLQHFENDRPDVREEELDAEP